MFSGSALLLMSASSAQGLVDREAAVCHDDVTAELLRLVSAAADRDRRLPAR
jgi:hypothetical protein